MRTPTIEVRAIASKLGVDDATVLSMFGAEERNDSKKGIASKTSEKGCHLNETRATFIVNKNLLEKVKALAYWARVDIKDVIGVALSELIDRHERKHGIIKPRK